jgi:hypothetical protein
MAFEGLAEENNDLFDLLSHYKLLPVDDDKDELLVDDDKDELLVDDDKDELLVDDDKGELMSIVVKLEKNQWNN